ncbi:MAG: HAMP domain-containing sensor histidine kinase [Chloroflexota bacterium]
MTDAGGEGRRAEPTLGRRSIRVALSATAIVAVVYLLVSAAVLAITTQALTTQIDQGLTRAATRFQNEPTRNAPPPQARNKPNPPTRDGPFGPVLILWIISPDGTVQGSDTTAVLPEDQKVVAGLRTAQVGDASVRLVSWLSPDGDTVVMGQSLQPVADAQSTILLAELLIAPFLLGAVFIGSVAIGRRVAQPIERARQRQLAFTADASHELRTPLSVIEAQTSLALSADRDALWYRKAFERVDRESKRLRHLVEDLLWLARFDSGGAHPDAEPVDVSVIVERAADRFAVVAETRGVELSWVRGPGNPVILAPAEWMDRLLGVLLDNACKYAGRGGRVEVRLAAEGGRVRLSVDDSGPGIPPDDRDRIFDRFHRGIDSKEGAGLGLAIGDAVVRATGGRWKVGESPLGGASIGVGWTQAQIARSMPGAAVAPRSVAPSEPPTA